MQLWAVVLMGTILIAASGSVAYACGGGHGGGGCDTSSHGQGSGSQCNQPDIVWENPSGHLGSAASVACSLTLTTSTLYAVVGNLAPGQNCTFYAVLANIGTATASLSQSISTSQPATCRLFSLTDNLPSNPVKDLAPKGTFDLRGSISLSGAATNKCQAAAASFSVTITGTETECGPGPWVIPAATVDPDGGGGGGC